MDKSCRIKKSEEMAGYVARIGPKISSKYLFIDHNGQYRCLHLENVYASDMNNLTKLRNVNVMNRTFFFPFAKCSTAMNAKLLNCAIPNGIIKLNFSFPFICSSIQKMGIQLVWIQQIRYVSNT